MVEELDTAFDQLLAETARVSSPKGKLRTCCLFTMIFVSVRDYHDKVSMQG